MSLSNKAVIRELQSEAKGHLWIVQEAAKRTPERSTGFLGLRPERRAEDVKQKIREILKEKNL